MNSHKFATCYQNKRLWLWFTASYLCHKWHKGRPHGKSPFKRSTGNDIYKWTPIFTILFFFLHCQCCSWNSCFNQKHYLAKVFTKCPKSWDFSSHFGVPWWPFWILQFQVVSEWKVHYYSLTPAGVWQKYKSHFYYLVSKKSLRLL